MRHSHERCFPLPVTPPPLPPLNLANIFMTSLYFGVECNIYATPLTLTHLPLPPDPSPPPRSQGGRGGGGIIRSFGIGLELACN